MRFSRRQRRSFWKAQEREQPRRGRSPTKDRQIASSILSPSIRIPSTPLPPPQLISRLSLLSLLPPFRYRCTSIRGAPYGLLVGEVGLGVWCCHRSQTSIASKIYNRLQTKPPNSSYTFDTTNVAENTWPGCDVRARSTDPRESRHLNNHTVLKRERSKASTTQNERSPQSQKPQPKKRSPKTLGTSIHALAEVTY